MTALVDHDHAHDHAHDHDHPHDHVHGHEHPHLHEPVDAVTEGQQHHGPSYEGTAVLDIGGTIGAVVLHTGPELEGIEIDLPGLDAGTPSTHSLVRVRHLPGGTQYAAVYPQLPEGRYRIGATGGHPARDVVVRGGEITEIDCRPTAG